jgi:hypothetical protein
MTMFPRIGILALALFSIAATVRMQKTDFSGLWNFKDQESISGTLYGNGSPRQIKITQKSTEIAIEKTTADENGKDVTSTDSLNFEKGAFEKITKSKRKKRITIQWTEDGKGFTQITTIYTAADNTKPEFAFTDKYSMENGNLVLIRKAENFENGESWESKAVYEKIKDSHE